MFRSFRLGDVALAVLVLSTLTGCEQPGRVQEPGALPRHDAPEHIVRLNATTLFAHAHLLERQGIFERAAIQYEKALRQRPNFVSARNRLGITLNKLGRHAEASAAFADAIAQKPDQPYLYNNYGFSLYLEGKDEEAAAILAQAIELNPDFSRARMNYAVVLAWLGEHEAAFEQLTRVGTQADACYNMGILLTESGLYAEAAQYLEAALELKPKYEAARNQLRAVARLAAQHEAHLAATLAAEHALSETHLAAAGEHDVANGLDLIAAEPPGAQKTAESSATVLPSHAVKEPVAEQRRPHSEHVAQLEDAVIADELQPAESTATSGVSEPDELPADAQPVEVSPSEETDAPVVNELPSVPESTVGEVAVVERAESAPLESEAIAIVEDQGIETEAAEEPDTVDQVLGEIAGDGLDSAPVSMAPPDTDASEESEDDQGSVILPQTVASDDLTVGLEPVVSEVEQSTPIESQATTAGPDQREVDAPDWTPGELAVPEPELELTFEPIWPDVAPIEPTEAIEPSEAPPPAAEIEELAPAVQPVPSDDEGPAPIGDIPAEVDEIDEINQVDSVPTESVEAEAIETIEPLTTVDTNDDSGAADRTSEPELLADPADEEANEEPPADGPRPADLLEVWAFAELVEAPDPIDMPPLDEMEAQVEPLDEPTGNGEVEVLDGENESAIEEIVEELDSIDEPAGDVDVAESDWSEPESVDENSIVETVDQERRYETALSPDDAEILSEMAAIRARDRQPAFEIETTQTPDWTAETKASDRTNPDDQTIGRVDAASTDTTVPQSTTATPAAQESDQVMLASAIEYDPALDPIAIAAGSADAWPSWNRPQTLRLAPGEIDEGFVFEFEADGAPFAQLPSYQKVDSAKIRLLLEILESALGSGDQVRISELCCRLESLIDPESERDADADNTSDERTEDPYLMKIIEMMTRARPESY